MVLCASLSLSTLPLPLPLLVVVVVVLVLIDGTRTAQAQGLPGLLIMQVGGYTALRSSDLPPGSQSITYMSTETTCLDLGGTPAANANTRLSNAIAHAMAALGATATSAIYTGSSAAPSLATTTCAEKTPTEMVGRSSANCFYRWRYGFYDAFTYMGEPGTAYWANLYYTDTPERQVLNQFQQFSWYIAAGSAATYPHGYFAGIASYNPRIGGMVRSDTRLIPVDNDPFPLSGYMIVCEYQLYPDPVLTTTRMPQPAFVNGFKDLTWSQSHWWVIFLMVAILVLGLFMYIIVFCCVTSTKPKEEPPLFQMVVRERVGKTYVVHKESPGVFRQPPAGTSSVPLPQKLTPQQEEQRQRQMRQGQGFNFQGPADSEDTSMGVVNIYGGGTRTDYADVKGFSNGNTTGGDLENIGRNALSEEALETSNKWAADDDGTSEASTILIARRRSQRRTRSHGRSQSFGDIELPQAGEIDEMNINL